MTATLPNITSRKELLCYASACRAAKVAGNPIPARGAISMRDADLRDADLSDADMRGADMRGADLIGANLRDADLIDADMRDADLIDADIRGADLPAGYAIASLCFGGWAVTVTPEITTIGSQSHASTKWLAWAVDAPEIAAMHKDASAWWLRHRDAVHAVIRDVMHDAGGVA